MQHRESTEAAGALDNALLELMLDHPRPWSEFELARTTSLPGDIPSALARLSYDGLVNRWEDLASPTYAAARFFGIHHDRSEPEEERIHEFAVLEALLARDCSGRKAITRKALFRAMQVKKKNRLAFIDAIPVWRRSRGDSDGCVRPGCWKAPATALPVAGCIAVRSKAPRRSCPPAWGEFPQP